MNQVTENQNQVTKTYNNVILPNEEEIIFNTSSDMISEEFLGFDDDQLRPPDTLKKREEKKEKKEEKTKAKKKNAKNKKNQ